MCENAEFVILGEKQNEVYCYPRRKKYGKSGNDVYARRMVGSDR